MDGTAFLEAVALPIQPDGNWKIQNCAFLTDDQVVDRIIDHLKLRFVTEKPPPARAFLGLAMVADPPVEYFP